MKPTDEQHKEFWEGCRWKTQTKPYEASFADGAVGEHFDVTFWYSPDEPEEPQPPPDIDLNNLFEYAVEDEWDVNFYFDRCAQDQNCIINLPNEREYEGAGNTRAEALFWALYPLVKEQK